MRTVLIPDFRKSLLFWLASSFLLGGCSLLLGPLLADPYIQLDRATGLIRQNRPLPAEPLIVNAMAAYEKQNNLMGVGLANQDYGILLTSADLAPRLRQHHFLDSSVTSDNRLAKGAEYFDRSLDYFRRAAQQDLDAADYSHLYMVYFNTAVTYHWIGKRAQACDWMEKSAVTADEYDRRKPNAKASRSHRELMQTFLKNEACAADSAASPAE